jgi:hypothetical protein
LEVGDLLVDVGEDVVQSGEPVNVRITLAALWSQVFDRDRLQGDATPR